LRMPIISTHTTTTRSSRVTTTTVPIWLVKLITCILCIVILCLIFNTWPGHAYYNTFLFVCITTGCLLGWSVGSVLQQLLTMRNVEISINFMLTALSVVAAVLCLVYLINTQSDSNFKFVVGMTVCFICQSLVCILMLSWACYGNIVVLSH
ncbi:hypothetical protein PENTCL1PPCAC_24487, partial [Pristionchus entomophagus]